MNGKVGIGMEMGGKVRMEMGGMERLVYEEWKGWYRWKGKVCMGGMERLVRNGKVGMGGMERLVWVE